MNCIVGQSGGPTSVINSSLSGVITAAIKNNFNSVYATLNGIEGVISDNIVEIDKEKFLELDVKNQLKKRPSSILGSCRFKLPSDLKDEVYETIFKRFREYKITSFIYIGGNDSMDTVMKLNQYMEQNNIDGINIVGVPKTIDNDLCEIDHSPGFASAAKYVLNTLKTIKMDIDIYDLKSVTFVEIMGRNAGWLAASSLLINSDEKEAVDLIYLGEMNITKEQILSEIKREVDIKGSIIVVVSEGFMDSEKYFENQTKVVFDSGFNHPVLSGIAQKLSDYTKDRLGIKTRAIEFSIVQRTSNIISKTDSEEAFELGYRGLELSISNTNIIPILKRKNTDEYNIEYTHIPSFEIANKERKIPEDWFESYKKLQNNIKKYVSPLIVGEVDHTYDNGILRFIDLKDFIKK